MFNAPFVIGEKLPPVVKEIPVREKLKPEQTSITFNRNPREDLDYKGYKAYLYYFKHVTEVGDKEIYECIISAATIDEAIEIFVADAVWGDDWYVDAVYDVEIMGIDLHPDREDKWVMELS